MEEREGYQVIVFTKRLPGSFHAPSFLRKFLSNISEAPNSQIGDDLLGMPLSEAKKIAKETDSEVYVDGYGRLRSSRGVVVRVR